MRARMLNAMQRCKKEIEEKALEVPRVPHTEEAGVVLHEHQRTLDPHGFGSSMQDVWQVSGISAVITNGIDEEFNTCTEGVAS